MVNKCAEQPWMFALSFDWVTLALRQLDEDQKGPEDVLPGIELHSNASAPGSPSPSPGPSRRRAGQSASLGTARSLACPYKVRS